jgi:hypothetical protein
MSRVNKHLILFVKRLGHPFSFSRRGEFNTRTYPSCRLQSYRPVVRSLYIT